LKLNPLFSNKSRFLIFLLLALALPLVLAACGGDETATSAPTAPATTVVSNGTAGSSPGAAAVATPTVPAGTPYPASTAGVPPSPTPAGTVKSDQQVLNLTLSGEVNTFDPALASDAPTTFILRQLYSGLVTLDQNLNVVPDLAAKMPDLSENGALYTFQLRQGAKFQSGREITADDFKYSLERATDPKLAAPDLPATMPATTYMLDIVGVKDKLDGKATEISGVQVKDKYTLQIRLDAPKTQFLAKLVNPIFYVVNREAVAKGFDQVDGSGPFKLVEYRRNQYLKLARNDNYYFGPPRLSQINLVSAANASSNLTAYQQGQVDVTGLTAPADIAQALDKSGPFERELVAKPQLALSYVGFNTRARPFDDPKVRQAFSLVADRPRIARAMFENRVQPATGLLPPGLPGYTARPAPLNYDISRARDLIAQSSYRTPSNLPRIVLYSTGDPLGGVLQDVYKQAFGIDLEVRQYDYKNFQTGLSQHQFQMYLYNWTADYPDPENFLRPLLGSGGNSNYTGYNNPQFDDLLKQGDQLVDPARRMDLYAQAEQLALTDAAILPVYYPVDYTLVKPYVKGLDVTALGIWSLRNAYILK
jgi:peptide/nickel transport system substrate-binding protein/oligopeptide transport system substrate-binding protein